LGLTFAGSASASLITYDVDMNYDPTTEDGGPGPATITGTFTIDTSDLDITNLDLTQATNSSATFGGAFGSQTFTSLTYTNSNSTVNTSSGQQPDKFSGNPFLFVAVQSDCCLLDGIEVGPNFQFDFPTAGGAVQPGNFDSVTSPSNYLYGTVTPEATGPTPVPEPASWVMLITGFGLAGVAAALRRRHRFLHLVFPWAFRTGVKVA
jgi:hypothetical protein